MQKVKGFADRSIKAPGFHLHSKYNLEHTRQHIDGKKGKKSFALMLAPMVDLFSVLVIYLIMNFSSTGEVFFIGKEIKIPQAMKGAPMESFPLVSLVRDRVTLDSLLDNGAASIFVEEKNDGNSPKLRAKLREIRAMEVKIAGEKGFRGQINVQADIGMDVDEVKKVMKLLIQEGWSTINFIIEPNAELTY